MVDKLTKILTEAVTEQNRIGWGNFLKGRISRLWGRAQQVHYSTRYEKASTETETQEAEKHTGEHFQLCVIREIWKFFETLWDKRNDDCHEVDTNTESPSLRMQRMKNRAHELCQEKRRLLIADQKIFPESIEDVLRRRPQQIESWIIDANKIVQLAFEESETLARNPITEYFLPIEQNEQNPNPTENNIDNG